MGAERLIPVVVLVALAAGCRSGPEPLPVARDPATVGWVNDGDTLTLEGGERVRLVQVDAPELHGDCYGRSALAALTELAPKGAHVTLERDPVLDDRDRYGRLLRYVFAGGENVNLELVREGAASPYFFRGERGRYADDLLDAVEAARDAGRGYWGACPAAKLNTGLGSVTGPS